MKRYKHKLSDSMAEQTDEKTIYKITSSMGLTHIPSNLIEGTNDWEEVKEEIAFGGPLFKPKEEPKYHYLITAFRCKYKPNPIFKIDEEGFYTEKGYQRWALDEMLNGDNGSVRIGDWGIYSVKNTKGVEWTIGDEWLCDSEWFTIESFATEMGIHGKLIMTAILRGGGNMAIDGLEKTEKPNYLITAFRSHDGIIRKLNQRGMYSRDGVKTEHKLESFTLNDNDSLIDGRQEIYSVKNYIGEEFTIGEVVMCEKEKFTISKFAIFNFGKDIIMASFKETNSKLNNLSGSNIESIFKTKTPIFVSADGVELFENNIDNILYSVLPKENWNETTNRVGFLIKIPTKEWLHFYAKEARQEYIDNNKPKYSLVDILNIDVKMQHGSYVRDRIILELKKIGK